jgi:MYND finger
MVDDALASDVPAQLNAQRWWSDSGSDGREFVLLWASEEDEEIEIEREKAGDMPRLRLATAQRVRRRNKSRSANKEKGELCYSGQWRKLAPEDRLALLREEREGRRRARKPGMPEYIEPEIDGDDAEAVASLLPVFAARGALIEGRLTSTKSCPVCAAAEGATAPEQGGEDAVPPRLRTCTGCRLVAYCGQAHQRSDWASHAGLCRAVRERIASLTAFRESLSLYDFLFDGATDAAPSVAYAALSDVLRVRCRYLHSISDAAVGPWDADPKSRRGFARRFVRKAARKELLPAWWTDTHSEDAVEFMTQRATEGENDMAFDLGTEITDNDIRSRWGEGDHIEGLLRQFGDLVESSLPLYRMTGDYLEHLLCEQTSGSF